MERDQLAARVAELEDFKLANTKSAEKMGTILSESIEAEIAAEKMADDLAEALLENCSRWESEDGGGWTDMNGVNVRALAAYYKWKKGREKTQGLFWDGI